MNGLYCLTTSCHSLSLSTFSLYPVSVLELCFASLVGFTVESLWWFRCSTHTNELQRSEQPSATASASCDGSGDGLLLRRRRSFVGEEGEEALHHHQVPRELDRGRARQVSRSSSIVCHRYSLSLYMYIYISICMRVY